MLSSNFIRVLLASVPIRWRQMNANHDARFAQLIISRRLAHSNGNAKTARNPNNMQDACMHTSTLKSRPNYGNCVQRGNKLFYAIWLVSSRLEILRTTSAILWTSPENLPRCTHTHTHSHIILNSFPSHELLGKIFRATAPQVKDAQRSRMERVRRQPVAEWMETDLLNTCALHCHRCPSASGCVLKCHGCTFFIFYPL